MMDKRKKTVKNKFQIYDRVYYLKTDSIKVRDGVISYIESNVYGEIFYHLEHTTRPSEKIPEENCFSTLEEMFYSIPEIIRGRILLYKSKVNPSMDNTKIKYDISKDLSPYQQRETTSENSFTKSFDELLDKIRSLMLSKNHDYANEDPLSNLKLSEKAGVPAWKGVCGVRLSDKFSRIQNFCRKETFEVKDESLEDTLFDMAVYSLLGILLYRQEKEKCKK